MFPFLVTLGWFELVHYVLCSVDLPRSHDPVWWLKSYNSILIILLFVPGGNCHHLVGPLKLETRDMVHNRSMITQMMMSKTFNCSFLVIL